MKIQYWHSSRAEWLDTAAPIPSPQDSDFITFRVLDDAGLTVAEWPQRVAAAGVGETT